MKFSMLPLSLSLHQYIQFWLIARSYVIMFAQIVRKGETEIKAMRGSCSCRPVNPKPAGKRCRGRFCLNDKPDVRQQIGRYRDGTALCESVNREIILPGAIHEMRFMQMITASADNARSRRIKSFNFRCEFTHEQAASFVCVSLM